MARPIRIYVENKKGVALDYEVTMARIRAAIPRHAAEAEIVVTEEASPNYAALAEATHFIGAGFDPRRLQRHGRSLSVIHCTSAGVERYLPLDWLPEGAVLTNSSGVHAEKGGAFGAMAILMLNEGAPRHATNQRRRLWDGTLSTSVTGKTVVICGFGSLGEAVAARIKPFGVKVIGVRRSGEPHLLADEVYRPALLPSALPRADFLVLSCPLTAQTRRLIGARALALLPKGAGVLNIARAGVLDNEALAKALRSGHLSGAIVDVFDPEPLSENAPWWDVPNLMIFPHTSCDDGVGYIDRCLRIFAENLDRYVRGDSLTNVVSGTLEY
jgi:glyoxylate/hydroxypyruvate reductase